MLGYLVGSTFLAAAIQAFWLVAVEAADRIATSPPSGRWSAASLMMVSPIRSTPESNEITVMPRDIAFFSTGTRASGSLAEMAMALTFCAISELITSICASAVALVGPV